MNQTFCFEENYWSEDLQASKYFCDSHLTIPVSLWVLSWFQNEILGTWNDSNFLDRVYIFPLLSIISNMCGSNNLYI